MLELNHPLWLIPSFLFSRYITNFNSLRLEGWPRQKLITSVDQFHAKHQSFQNHPLSEHAFHSSHRQKLNSKTNHIKVNTLGSLILEKSNRNSLKNLISSNYGDREPDLLKEITNNVLVAYEKNPWSKNTINIHNSDTQDSSETVTLVLKPIARAIAGDKGKAIATPLSKAILRHGINVDILFEPEAVAIAGPGGIAHAESDLEISYEDTV